MPLRHPDAFSAGHGDGPEQLTAHRRLTGVSTPVVAAVPPESRGELEPAEVVHEELEHRSSLSERAGRDAGLRRTGESDLDAVLAHRPGEVAVLPAADAEPLALPRSTTGTPDLLAHGPERAPSRRRAAAVVLLLVLALAAVLTDRWAAAREVDTLVARAQAGRSAVTYADRRVWAVLSYASPALQSPDVDPAVRASVADLVRQAAADRVAGVERTADAARGLRVLPWHRDVRQARAGLAGYLDAEAARLRAVAADLDALRAPHPALDARLVQARAAYARLAPGDTARLTSVLPPGS